MRVWKLLPLLTALLLAVPAYAGHTWHRYIRGWNHTSFNEEVESIAAGAAANSFETWDTPSGVDIEADAADDTVQLIASGNITISGGGAADTVTFTVTDEVGAVTANAICQGDGSKAVCNITDLAGLNTALGTTIADGPHTAAAVTYYVDQTSGNDSNDGLSPGAAWKTIAKVNAATFLPGDRILFKRGETWSENLVVPNSGAAGSPIVFGAYGDATNAPIIGTTGSAISGTDIDYITIQDLKIANWTTEGIKNISGDHWTIQRNWITGGSTGCVNRYDDCSVGSPPCTQDQCAGSAPCMDAYCDSDAQSNSIFFVYGIYMMGNLTDAANMQGIKVLNNEIGSISGTPYCSFLQHSDYMGWRGGIWMYGLDNALISDNYLHDILGWGINVRERNGASPPNPVNNIITNNRIENFVGFGIGYAHGDYGLIKGNDIIDGCGIGMYFHLAANYNTVSHNVIDNIKQSGLEGAGNELYNGIDVNRNADYNIFEHNKISRVVSSSISIEDVEGSCDGNIVRYNWIDGRTGRTVGGDDDWDYTANYPDGSKDDYHFPVHIYASSSGTPTTWDTVEHGNVIFPGNNDDNQNVYASIYYNAGSRNYYTLSEWAALDSDVGNHVIVPEEIDFTARTDDFDVFADDDLGPTTNGHSFYVRRYSSTDVPAEQNGYFRMVTDEWGQGRMEALGNLILDSINGYITVPNDINIGRFQGDQEYVFQIWGDDGTSEIYAQMQVPQSTDWFELTRGTAGAGQLLGFDVQMPLKASHRLHIEEHNLEATFPNAGSIPNVSGGNMFRTGTSAENISDFGWDTVGQIVSITNNGSGNARVEATGHGLSNNDKITIGGTALYNGWYTATVIDANNFDLDTAYISDAGAVGSFGLRASEMGQILAIQSRGNINYQCWTGQLSCGSQNIPTSFGDYTVWLSKYASDGVVWQLIGLTKADHFYGDHFLPEVSPRTFGTTRLGDTAMRGYLEIGEAFYFAKDDVTPSVQQGVSFYSWECEDSYNRHCVDLYDSRDGGPCGDYHCSGSPDGFCDSDGVSSVTAAPSRVLTPLDIDLFAPGAGNTVVTAPDHHLDAGDTCVIAGTTSYNGTRTVGDIGGSCASVADHPTDPNAIRVTCSNHGLIDGERIDYIGTTHSDYDGQWDISYVDANTFDLYIAPDDWTTTTAAVLKSLDRFSINATYVADESDGATYEAVDNYCDADAATDYTATVNWSSPVTIRGFDDAVDNQLISVVTKNGDPANDPDSPTAQPIYFECDCVDAGPDGFCDYDGVTPVPGKLRCGDETWPSTIDGPHPSVSLWRYDEIGDFWQIVSFGDFSSINYAVFDQAQTFYGLQEFSSGGVKINAGSSFTSHGDIQASDDVSLCDVWEPIGDTASPTFNDETCWLGDVTKNYFSLGNFQVGDIKFIKSTTDGIDYDCAGGGSKLLCGAVDLETDTGDITGWIESTNNEVQLLFHHDESIDMNLAHYALTSEVAAGYVPLDGSVAMTGDLEIETGGIDIEDGAGNATVLDYDSDSFFIRPHTTRSIYIGDGSGVSATATSNVAVGSGAGESLVAAGENVLLGLDAGGDLANGTGRNVYVGYQAGDQNAAGNSNTVIGYNAGGAAGATYSNFTGVGYNTGAALAGGTNNLFFGYNAGYAVDSGTDNIIFGQNLLLTSGDFNVLLGRDAGSKIVSTNGNIGLNFRALRYQTGTENIGIGSYALAGTNGVSAGSNSIAIGDSAGYLYEGSRAIFLGQDAGRFQTTTDDIFILDNRSRGSAATELTNALMVGIMAAAPADQTLDLNAVVTISEKLLVEGDGTGTFGTYDAEIGSGDHGAIRLGSGGIYSSSFVSGNIDLGNTMVFRQEQAVDGILEFAWMEGGNTIRAGIPESGAGNAANWMRSFMIAGPYSAATGDNHFICDTHTAYNGNIDCDTGTTGADMFVQDDLEVEGIIYAHETINFEGATADGNHVILAVDDPAADVTHTFPAASGRLANDDRKCAYVKTGLTTGLQLESLFPAHKNMTITGIWCETDAGTVGMDFNIDDGTPAGVNGSDISCSTTPTWDQVLAGDTDFDQGDRLDLDIGTVATATRLTACFDIALD